MPADTRPNPDALLADVQPLASEERVAGRLKVFFGAAPGVGKTFAMLEEARKSAAEGIDVVIGYAEPHIRPDTESLLLGMEILPYRLVEYRGTVLKEFDIDAALARKPRLVCVDELAHTNAPGLRHAKRWQDVFELLDAGIDVYSTLNVQHLESVNDVVRQITDIEVRETLPDEVLDRADEIELIDTTPEELTQRLREGKIYRPDVAERALRNFFNRGNLTALRELALRRTAERVDTQMQKARKAAKVTQTWAASERVLVCVGPSPLSARLVRSTRRLAAGLTAPWMAVNVETPASLRLSPEARQRATEHLRLAEQLGGEAVTIAGDDIASAVVNYARDRNVTKIVVGKPTISRFRERLFGSVVDDIIRRSGEMDVYVIRGDASGPAAPATPPARSRRTAFGLLAAVGVTVVSTFAGWVVHRHLDLAEINVLMIYLLGVLGIATFFNRRSSLLASFLGVLAFDYVFVEPYFSFAVSDREYIFTFLVMLLTGLLISTLVQRVRGQAELFRTRQLQTQAIFEFTREIAAGTDVDAISRSTAARLAAFFHVDVSLLLPDAQGELIVRGSHGSGFASDPKEKAVARWALDHNQPAGAGTDTLPLAWGFYVPLRGAADRAIGIIALRPAAASSLRDPSQRRLLDSFASQAATAIERAGLAGESRLAWQRLQEEHLRNTLLSAVSHDLRTPLTSITGAASALADPAIALPEASRRELAATILGESRRLERVVGNLLEISRIESGGLTLRKTRTDVVDLVESVLSRHRDALANREVTTFLERGLEVALDATAIDQVVTNLVQNALDHTPEGSPIDIKVKSDEDTVVVEVADRGPGLPPRGETAVFEKFYRAPNRTDRMGLGLGLAIATAIIEAHGGTIEANNRAGGGAVFRFRLPREGDVQMLRQEK